MRDKREGMIAGFVCGIILDLSTGLLFGVHTLALLLIGFLNGFFRRIFAGVTSSAVKEIPLKATCREFLREISPVSL
jgi:rod shape-determining protein MreD